MSVRRYILTLFLVVCAITTAAAQPAKSMQPIRVHVYPGNFVSLYAYIGVAKGFYAAEGLDAKLIPIATGPQAVAALAGNSVDVILLTPDVMINAKARGLSSVAIVGNQIQPIFVLVKRAGLETPEQFPEIIRATAGKAVGVFGLGSASDRFVKVLLRGAGLKDSDVQYLPLGGEAQIIASLRARNVDFATMTIGGALTASLSKTGNVFVDCSRNYCPAAIKVAATFGQGYWVTQGYLSKNEGTATAFSTAHRKIDAWAKNPANKAELISIIRAQLPAPGEVDADRYYDAIATEVPRYFGIEMNAPALKSIADTMHSTGELISDVPMEDMIWSPDQK